MSLDKYILMPGMIDYRVPIGFCCRFPEGNKPYEVACWGRNRGLW